MHIQNTIRAADAPYNRLIVVLAAISMTATLPGRTHGLGLILTPMIQDLKIHEVSFGIINFFTVLVGSAFCRPTGWIMDRYGARPLLSSVVAALGLAVIAMTYASGPWSLFAALLITRGLAQGSLSVISTTLMGKWFANGVASAMSVYAFLLGLGVAGSVALLAYGVRDFGWRAAWCDMGWILLAFAPISWWLVRSPSTAQRSLDVDQERGYAADYTVRAALRTPGFWIFSAGLCLFGFTWTGITLYSESMLAARGFADHFSEVMIGLVITCLAANLFAGRLAKRSLQAALAIGMGLFAASLLLYDIAYNRVTLLIYSGLLGTAAGLMGVVQFSFLRMAFGRTQLGQIQGVFQMMFVVSSALGPLTMALMHEWTGSYSFLCICLIPLALLFAILGAGAKLPAAT